MQNLKILDLIEQKKRGLKLNEAQIKFWVEGLVSGVIPDYQTASLLMAIRLQGMDFDETLALTQAMANSGTRLSFPSHAVVSDKHSTGGVGDKVTLILAPILAACGLPVSMLSGRGLGHTGGTIDKFESLEGASCQQSPEAMATMLRTFGWANAQASAAMNPADRILYEMRDATATVDSIPLITASIISKKLAGGATHLCLDVKCGEAAFMQQRDQARALAKNLAIIGEMGGMKVSGFLTRMEEPLGHAIGNYLELLEAVIYLKSWQTTPLMELVAVLGVDMLVAAGVAHSESEARSQMLQAVSSGESLARLLGYLDLIGGKSEAIDKLKTQRFEDFPRRPVLATGSGFITGIRGRFLGEALIDLGAGRKQRDDVIDPSAGLVLAVHVGDQVAAGEPLAWLYGTRREKMSDSYLKGIAECFELGSAPPEKNDMILETLSGQVDSAS